ncbi:MAG TPA: HAD family phosphatase [Acidimicrobiales bacterium]|nr:HAD family phosphatase [Acidimicrobiales bacterium]
MYDGLLLDVGGVILDPWQALDAYATATGIPVPGRGPVDPEGDPLWREKLSGTLTLNGYWDNVARRTGHDSWRSMFRSIMDLVPDELFDHDAFSLMHDARAAGHRVGVLSNDAYTIQSRAFFDARPAFRELDAFVDASDIGVSKPDPDAYLVAAEALGLPTEKIVFLDDAEENVEGARAVGMLGIQVDAGAATMAFDQAREVLGLAP